MSQCLWCGYEPIRSSYELCFNCYDDLQVGIIDKCQCGNYKDSEYDVCFDCYQNKSNRFQTRKKTTISDNMIKGRIAETIVQEMFLAMGYDVYPFGMEHTVPGFSDRFSPKNGLVANKIRKMPDFIVVKDDQSFFLEVKYRSDENHKFNLQDYPYPEAYFVLVTSDHIKIQLARNLMNGSDFEYLNRMKDFETDREIILKYIEFVKKFFDK